MDLHLPIRDIPFFKIIIPGGVVITIMRENIFCKEYEIWNLQSYICETQQNLEWEKNCVDAIGNYIGNISREAKWG